MDVTRVGGMPRFSELVMDFREQGGRAVGGGLDGSSGGDHSSPSSLTAFFMIRMSSSTILSLALREEDGGKVSHRAR